MLKTKMKVVSVTQYERIEGVKMEGQFSAGIPCASLQMSVQTPELIGAFKPGQIYNLELVEHVD